MPEPLFLVCRDCTEIRLFNAEGRSEGRSRYAGASGGGEADIGGVFLKVGERRPGSEVNRGRIYERVDGCGRGGGDGGFGGGNQLCRDKRARSGVTWRFL